MEHGIAAREALSKMVRSCLHDVLQNSIDPADSARRRFIPLRRAIEADKLSSSESCDLLLAYIQSFLKLCSGLARAPILIPYEYQEERQRTHADMQAEAAMEIRNLPRAVAYGRIFHADSGTTTIHKMHLVKPPNPSSSGSHTLNVLGINAKIKRLEELKLDQFGSWAPELEFHRKSKEFQEAMIGFMKDASSPSLESQLQAVRARSREDFGTPRAEVEEQIRRRQQELVGEQGERAGTQKEQPDTPRPTIGRRPPKKP